MKKIVYFLFSALIIGNWATYAQTHSNSQEVKAYIDLNAVKDDKLMVTVIPPKSNETLISYHIPKIIPGTYSEDDYGKFIDNFKAYDKNGKELTVSKTDDNSWKIKNANNLHKITYWVNDTFDIESKHSVFSPAGTNIESGKNFILNNHAFLGYFSNYKDISYNVSIAHPKDLYGATSLIDYDPSDTNDVFIASRYNELIDNPIMYSKPDFTSFQVDGMEILFSVYSPNGIHNAKTLTTGLEKMIRAQKKFLGSINNNKKYTVLLYLSDMKKQDAKGFGALEHNTSTTVVFPEMMSAEELGQQLKDVVSHEFFHIVTPLSIHSEEIHYFDFNKPKMSKHLWMYEGVTEYFANLFQINQGLIDEDDFYNRIAEKIGHANVMDDTMSFTVMSANVLKKPYKDQYLNVYEKGALIGMCIDIIIREKSDGQKGILDLMQKLSREYGANKPFNDEELFAKIIELTYPEVGEFLKIYVEGTKPIPYEVFLAKVGVNKTKIKIPSNPFLNGQEPYITINPTTKEIIVLPNIELNDFMKSLGIKGGDVITSVNDVKYNLDNIYELIIDSQNWKSGETININIKRNNTEKSIKGKVVLSFIEEEGYLATDTTKTNIKEAWLKS